MASINQPYSGSSTARTLATRERGDQEGRQAHLSGTIAKALIAKADELLAVSPQIEPVTLLAVK